MAAQPFGGGIQDREDQNAAPGRPARNARAKAAGERPNKRQARRQEQQRKRHLPQMRRRDRPGRHSRSSAGRSEIGRRQRPSRQQRRGAQGAGFDRRRPAAAPARHSPASSAGKNSTGAKASAETAPAANANSNAPPARQAAHRDRPADPVTPSCRRQELRGSRMRSCAPGADRLPAPRIRNRRDGRRSRRAAAPVPAARPPARPDCRCPLVSVLAIARIDAGLGLEIVQIHARIGDESRRRRGLQCVVPLRHARRRCRRRSPR